jgi:hypothetical protein
MTICKGKNCKKRSNFNVRGLKTGLYCSTHKLPDMINVETKTCFHEDCETIPNYNVRGLKMGLYCATHKLDGMIDVIHKSCFHEDCETQPKYNVRGLKTGLYCVEHKLDGMINVLSKTCFHEDCETQPKYNVRGLKIGLYCSTHKLDGMIDVETKTCFHEDCETQPKYNVRGLKIGLYCSTHKLDGMIDVIHKTCHLCDTLISNKQYRGHCLRCFINTFPTENVARNHKTKERNVVDCIKLMFPDLDWKEDRKVSCGCSQRRPDLFLDLATRVIVVEIDENQHTDYDSNCETKRMMEISQDVGDRDIVFIRFNPDNYKKDNVKITSCWGTDGNGLTIVKKSKIKEWKQRTDTLNTQIQYCIDNPSDKMIDVVHLFYDVV